MTKIHSAKTEDQVKQIDFSCSYMVLSQLINVCGGTFAMCVVHLILFLMR